MAAWVKWWKDKTLLKIIISMTITVIVAFLFAYFIDYGWIISILLVIISRVFCIKPLFKKKYNEIVNKL